MHRSQGPSPFMRAVGILVAALVPLTTAPVTLAASYYWDSDATVTANDGTTGAGLGNTVSPFIWDNLTSFNWWDGASLVSDSQWDNAGLNTAIFTGTAGTVTLGTAITAGALSFRSNNYTIAGGGNALTLSGPAHSIAVEGLGIRTTIDAQVSGTSGLTKTGNGVLVLTNNSNNYSGNTLVNSGTLVISNSLQLGSSNLIQVNGYNSVNFSGGTLVFQGGLGGRRLPRILLWPVAA